MRIAGASAKIRTKQLPNTTPERYYSTELLGGWDMQHLSERNEDYILVTEPEGKRVWKTGS
jgi:hypothetical protein